MSNTTNKNIEKPAFNSYIDNWNTPLNSNFDVIDAAFGSTTSLNATGGSATLTAAQYEPLFLSITGAISAPVTYTIPSGVGGQWIVYNGTTDSSGGPHAITIASGGGGTSTTVSRGYRTVVISDGTNIRKIDYVESASLPLSVANGGTGSGTASGARSNLSVPGLTTANSFSAGQSGAISALTDAATITPDFAVSNNFSLTIGGNRTLANPTNITAGQSGTITITQDATGGRTLSFGSYWKFPGGAAPSLTSTANAVDILVYFTQTTTKVAATILNDVS